MKHKFDEGQKLYGADGEATPEERYQILSDLEVEFTERLRNKRNEMLAETDWTQAEDIPQAIRDNWKPYRQSLRDITDTYSSLNDVVWPTKPE